MTRKKVYRYLWLILLAVFIIVQFFPIDKTNPESDPTKDFITLENPPQDIAVMLKNACYDCHSNHTKYPWYTNVAPFSWWIKGHIDHGREELNFSEWGNYSAKKASHKLEECYEKIENKSMPLTSYWVAHPEAKLSAEDRTKMVDWFKSIEVE